jgi:hypothetical protein
MLDGVSLDQLRTFIAVADEKSFSAAGRRLRRAQSVVSQTMANLEGQLGVKLFDRGAARLPVLTDQGRALLSDARAVAGDVDVLKARAKNLAGGLEPELSVAVDVMYPPAPLTAAVAAFQQEFPSTLLNFEVESSAVVEPVFDERCVIGLVGSWSRLPPNIAREPLLTVSVPTIVSPRHPLATYNAPIPATVLAGHIQLIHMESRGCFAKPSICDTIREILAPITPRVQTCVFARRARVWCVTAARDRGRPGKRRARSNHARGRAVRALRDSDVGHLSDRQPARAGGAMVLGASQTSILLVRSRKRFASVQTIADNRSASLGL